MTDSLRKSIESIRTLSPALNKATDEASRMVAVVEKFLGEECGVGIEARILVPTTRADETEEFLEYRRHNGRFRLVITESSIIHDDDGSPLTDQAAERPQHTVTATAWTEAPRQQKLETFAHLPGLMESIAAKIEGSIKSTNEAAAALRQITDALQPKPAKPGAGNKPPIAPPSPTSQAPVDIRVQMEKGTADMVAIEKVRAQIEKSAADMMGIENARAQIEKSTADMMGIENVRAQIEKSTADMMGIQNVRAQIEKSTADRMGIQNVRAQIEKSTADRMGIQNVRAQIEKSTADRMGIQNVRAQIEGVENLRARMVSTDNLMAQAENVRAQIERVENLRADSLWKQMERADNLTAQMESAQERMRPVLTPHPLPYSLPNPVKLPDIPPSVRAIYATDSKS